MSEVADKVKTQLEFYFSDSNFPRDKFLRAQAALSDEGYVAISTVATFTRMKALTEDIEVIKEAVKNSEFLKLDGTGTMVKRITPLPEDDTTIPRTIYAKGFPGKDGYSMEDVHSVFDKFGKILCVRLRKTADKKLKDSCFVEFATPDEAQAAAAAQSTFKNTPLKVLMRSDYYQKKKEEKKKVLDEKKAKRKAERDEQEKERGGKRIKTETGSINKEEIRTSGAVVKFTGIGKGLSWQTIQEAFAEFGPVAYVDFPKGVEASEVTEGFVRFQSADVAKEVVDKMKGAKITIGGQVPELKVLAESEEKDYWENAQIRKEERMAKRGEDSGERGGRGRGRGRGGRGGRGRGRGGRGGRGKRF